MLLSSVSGKEIFLKIGFLAGLDFFTIEIASI
jgi:hypothetical protein